jgi:predicted phosphodiesterase
MKLGIFTDSHYSSRKITCERRQNDQSLRKIREAYAHFEKEGCDLIVCLGDLIDTETTVEQEKENLAAIAAVMKGSHIPTVCLMGNHDAFVLTPSEFYQILRIPPIHDMYLHGVRLIFLDACYFRNGQHYAPGDTDWTNTFYPDEEALVAKLNDSTEDTYLFIHQSIHPDIDPLHRVANADTLFDAINQSGSVKAVFQGHYHPGHFCESHNVRYITLPAMCENENSFFVFDL